MAAIRRIQKELNDLARNAAAEYSAGPCGDNLFEWDAYIKGPPGTPYEGGSFLVKIKIPKEYPFKYPQMRMVTKIYHPNVNPTTGRFCKYCFITGDNWRPSKMIFTLLLGILALLKDPKLDCTSHGEAMMIYKTDRNRFNDNAQDWTIKYAMN